jgi:DNA-binding NtrC family response regulator
MAIDHQNVPGGEPIVFMVDDEPMLLDLAEVILGPEGFNVRTFRDPEQALAAYKVAKPLPEVFITDYAMEGMNGLDLIRECRKLHPEQKIIMVSGTVDESIFAMTEVKPDRFLTKPYNVDRFISAVKKLSSD